MCHYIATIGPTNRTEIYEHLTGSVNVGAYTTEKAPMKRVDAMHRSLLYMAFAVLCTAPSATYSAQGEGPDGPGRPHKPGKIVVKQIKFSLPGQEFGNTCRASVQLRFTQSDDQARVDATINNEDCTASIGKYELRLRITDATGERHTLRFSEDWSREDALPIQTLNFYDIGHDVVLTSIRLKAATCECANKSALPEQPQ